MSRLKYTFNMSLADIDRATPALATRAKSYKEDMHKVLTSLLAVWAADGDARKITNRMTLLANAEPYHAQAIVNWAGAFAKFEWNKDDGFTYTDTTIDADTFQAAKAEPFYEFSPAPEPKAYLFADKLDALLAAAGKRADKPQEGDDIPADLLTMLKETKAAWELAQIAQASEA